MKLPLTLLLISLPLGAASSQAAPPNIVFILADDLGWHDVGYNGEEFFETPHIDRLAASGMRFDRAYSGGPNCLPTRACLLSGMYTPRTQMWTPGGLSKGAGRLMRLRVPGPSDPDSDFPTKLHLEPSVVSLAEMLKSAGYATARFGKWHVGPDTQGFDVSDTNGHGGDLADRFYHVAEVTRWLTDASLEFIERHRDRPFFVYLSHWDVHVPLVADSAIVEKYREKRSSGRWDGPKNPTYAAMIEAVDTSVGRVRDKLQALGIAENTLLVFSSDNGGQGATTSNAPLRGEKGSLYEGGIRVPTTICWPREIAAGSQCDVPITSVDFMPTFAEVAQATLPAEQPVDGQSLVPLWSDKTNWTDRAIFWHFPLYLRSNGHPVEPVLGTDVMYWRAVPSSAICRGDWKLIENFEDNSAWLFNLRDDVGESTNLVARHPQVAAQLRAQLRDWRARVAAPVPQQTKPQFDPVAADRFANPNAPLGPFQATGFKVGEVTPTSAIVWTRLTLRRERNDSDGPRVIVKHGAVPDIDNRQQPVVAVEFENRATVRDLREAVPGVDGDVRLRYRPRGIESDWRATAWRPVDALRDFTHQFQIAGLEPGTSYELQVDSRDVAGDRGQSSPDLVRTAPAVYTVSTGQGNDDQDRPDGFNMYPEMRKLDPDFFVHTGDIVYYDNLAKTLALARYHWQRTYSWPTNVDFHRHVASYFIKDDHDTWINDCWPTQSTPHMHDFTFRGGQAVFREQVQL